MQHKMQNLNCCNPSAIPVFVEDICSVRELFLIDNDLNWCLELHC